MLYYSNVMVHLFLPTSMDVLIDMLDICCGFKEKTLSSNFDQLNTQMLSHRMVKRKKNFNNYFSNYRFLFYQKCNVSSER